MQRILLACAWFVAASSAPAADFTIELSARNGKPVMTAGAAYPSTTGKARAVLTTAADTPVTVRWTVGNRDQAIVKDALVHFFVVKTDKPNQQEAPKLTKGVVAESALTMDFRSKDRTEGQMTFAVRAPGSYMVRLELKGAAGKDEREPSATLDLLVR